MSIECPFWTDLDIVNMTDVMALVGLLARRHGISYTVIGSLSILVGTFWPQKTQMLGSFVIACFSQLLFFIVFFEAVAVMEIIWTNDERLLGWLLFAIPDMIVLSLPVGVATFIARSFVMFLMDRWAVRVRRN